MSERPAGTRSPPPPYLVNNRICRLNAISDLDRLDIDRSIWQQSHANQGRIMTSVNPNREIDSPWRASSTSSVPPLPSFSYYHNPPPQAFRPRPPQQHFSGNPGLPIGMRPDDQLQGQQTNQGCSAYSGSGPENASGSSSRQVPRGIPNYYAGHKMDSKPREDTATVYDATGSSSTLGATTGSSANKKRRHNVGKACENCRRR
jgi:hypothetical protein